MIDMAVRKRGKHHLCRLAANEASDLAVQLGNRRVSYQRRRDCEEFRACHTHDLERCLGLLSAGLENVAIVERWQMAGHDEHRDFRAKTRKAGNSSSAPQGFIIRMGCYHNEFLWRYQTSFFGVIKRVSLALPWIGRIVAGIRQVCPPYSPRCIADGRAGGR